MLPTDAKTGLPQALAKIVHAVTAHDGTACRHRPHVPTVHRAFRRSFRVCLLICFDSSETECRIRTWYARKRTPSCTGSPSCPLPSRRRCCSVFPESYAAILRVVCCCV